MTKKILINWLYFIGILLGAGFILPACRKTMSQLATYHPIGDTKTDTLLCYNMLPDSSAGYPVQDGYVLYVNDSISQYVGRGLTQQSACFGVSPAIAIPAQGGTFTLKLIYYPNDSIPPVTNPDPAKIVCQKTISVPAHSGYGRVVFYDSTGLPTISYMPLTSADPGAPAAGTFKLRVVNFGYSMSAYNGSVALNSAGTPYQIQLQYPDSTVVKGDSIIPFAGSSAYQQFNYGQQQFMVYNLTNQAYNNNSGPLNDVIGTFDLESPPVYGTVYNYANFLFPHLNLYQYPDNATTQLMEIGSYPFAAGGCYSIYVIGDIYAVSLDRMYGAGVLDNVGKIQIVNADPDEPAVQVSISTANGQIQVPSIPYGSYAQPNIIPAGPVTCTFIANGQTVASYTTTMSRLGYYTLYFTEDQNNLPLVFPQNTFIDPSDYGYGSPYNLPTLEYCHVSFLDLCPDAGNVFFTVQSAASGESETAINQIVMGVNAGPDLAYKASGGESIYDGTIAPNIFNLRLSSKRTDSLAGQLIATLPQPFPRTPCPGSYTLVAVGQLDAAASTKKPRLIMVQQSNFISKAQ